MLNHCFKYILLALTLTYVIGDDEYKSSVTFVIDDTASMFDDIDAVKFGANSIFDTVLYHNASQVMNFILVTFNDYGEDNKGVKVRASTQNRDEFKAALSAIEIGGGGDCPEYSMSGIKQGIEESLPLSDIYVFTDASAKDYKQIEEVKNIALAKQSKIVFVLTGTCDVDFEDASDYKVYPELANATSGEVFHLGKQEIGQILEYVKNMMKGRRVTLGQKAFPPGVNKFNFTADPKTKDVTLSLKSTDPVKPNVDITGPDGSKTSKKEMVDTDKITIYKVNVTKPGVHTVTIDSKSKTRTLVTALSEIDFRLGFSSFKPLAINDTSTRPVPDIKTHLSIKLIKGDIDLKAAKIIDMVDNVMLEMPLECLNEKTNLYITEAFDPPKTMFRVAIVGYDPESKTNLSRMAPTPVEIQKIIGTIKEKSPSVVIDGDANLFIKYGNPLELICKVNGYPKPNIVWKNKENGSILPSKISDVTLPYEYNSILTIDKVNENATYECEASDPSDNMKADSKAVTVKINQTKHFKELHTPQNIKVKYNEEAKMACLVDAYPPANITWYRDGVKVSSGDDIELSHNESIITIKQTKLAHGGKYLCEASNGKRRKLIFKYVTLTDLERPVIDKTITEVSTRKGSNAVLECKILKGIPKPSISWFKVGENTIIEEWKDKETVILANVVREDIGMYQCLAQSELGNDIHTINLFIQIPATIIPSMGWKRLVSVGSELSMPCRAEGIPKPSIKWAFHKFNTSASTRKTIKSEIDKPLRFQRIQLYEGGYYTCTASNAYGNESIVYEVQVFAPPTIENTYLDKHFVAVEGDRALRITCRASGNPKPRITWEKDGLEFGPGQEGSGEATVEENTLIILDVPTNARGIYKCIAMNSGGQAQEIYEVSVDKYPELRRPTSSIMIEQGKPATIKCNVPYQTTDQLRWYKDRELIHTGELTLNNSSLRDAGHYTCRVSNFNKSISGHINIDVGFKPEFTTKEDKNIEIREDAPVSLICENSGVPEPKVSWYHDGAILNSTNSTFNVISSPGQYRCEVRNIYGTISRTFIAAPRDCFINSSIITNLHPLLLTSRLQWPVFKKNNEFIVIPKGEQIVLVCPSRFKMVNKQYITAFCTGGMHIQFNGKKYDYSHFECTEEVTHIVLRSKEQCVPGNSESINILYNTIYELTTEVYEICWDNNFNVPIYAKHLMQSSLADNDYYYKANWSDSDQLSMNYEEGYDCETQTNIISTWLGKPFHRDDNCCYSKRQLVNPRDVFPGAAQRSTFSYFNVVPHWSTCNADNWEDVEQKVRNLAKTVYRDLLVWTGTAKNLFLPNVDDYNMKIYLSDRSYHHQPIPLFLWKVIQDPGAKSSLAIVQVNKPDLDPSEISRYTLCRDICNATNWMDGPNWHDVTRGYTYCCTIAEFERAFRLDQIFEPDMDKVLNNNEILLSRPV